MNEKRIILASASPRRRELLSQVANDFEVVLPTVDERLDLTLPPYEAAVKAAQIKARSVYNGGDSIVIGADTLVEYKGKVFLKPKDENDAAQILRQLSGKRHSVITGLCVISECGEMTDFCRSFVTFNVLSDSVIEKYIQSRLPLDKAGAYGIQDGFPIVKRYSGSYSNIVGLPLRLLSKMLKELGQCK